MTLSQFKRLSSAAIALSIVPTIILVYSAGAPTTALAAPPRAATYKAVLVVADAGVLEQTLNSFAAQGWDLHSVITTQTANNRYMLVLRKAF